MHFDRLLPILKKYALHSLRSGGATTAANLGISDRLFKKHGRWRSETAKDEYIKRQVNCFRKYRFMTLILDE
jgi:hypothetical protein